MNVIKHTDTRKITNQGKTDVLEECNTEIMAKKYIVNILINHTI